MDVQIPVVAAVITRGDLILGARKARGPLAGYWEFPGGKVERDETPESALAREIREELACEVEVGRRLGEVTHAYEWATIKLSTYRCELRSGMPTAVEHSEVRWFPRSAIVELLWAPADRPTLGLLFPGRQ